MSAILSLSLTVQIRSRLPHLKAIVQYTKRLSDKEEGIRILEVGGGDCYCVCVICVG